MLETETYACLRAEYGATPTAPEHFPFPFRADTYRPIMNVEPARVEMPTAAGAWGRHFLDIDQNYEAHLRLRADLLKSHPGSFTAFPHMMTAQWDAMLYLMKELATSYPQSMRLNLSGDWCDWHNSLTGQSLRFRHGELSDLPCEPLEYIGRRVQDDLILLDVRGDVLYCDAVFVTFAINWSPSFVTGMDFMEAHAFVPRSVEDGTVRRAEKFMTRMLPNQAFRRTSWAFHVGGRLDRSRESYPDLIDTQRACVQNIANVPWETLGNEVFIRNDVQHIGKRQGDPVA